MSELIPTVAILVDDMFFTAKINSAAVDSGRQIERIKTRDQLEGLAAKPPELVIIDLNSDRLNPLETIAFLKASPELNQTPIVSFVSHVQTDLIRAAQTAGCDHVLPRSAFTQLLTQIVSGDLSLIGSKPRIL